MSYPNTTAPLPRVQMTAAMMKNHPSWIVMLLTAHGVACLYLLLGIFTGFATPVFSVVRHLQ